MNALWAKRTCQSITRKQMLCYTVAASFARFRSMASAFSPLSLSLFSFPFFFSLTSLVLLLLLRPSPVLLTYTKFFNQQRREATSMLLREPGHLENFFFLPFLFLLLSFFYLSSSSYCRFSRLSSFVRRMMFAASPGCPKCFVVCRSQS